MATYLLNVDSTATTDSVLRVERGPTGTLAWVARAAPVELPKPRRMRRGERTKAQAMSLVDPRLRRRALR